MQKIYEGWLPNDAYDRLKKHEGERHMGKMKNSEKMCNVDVLYTEYTVSYSKVWGLYDFLMLLKHFSHAYQDCIYLNTVKEQYCEKNITI